MKKSFILFLFSFSVAFSKNVEYFSSDYLTARSKFYSSSASYKDVQQKTYKILNKVNADLSVDVSYFPALEEQKNLIILVSGVHGAEAYAGSAIQLQFLTEILPQIDRDHLGVLIIHSLNPFGFKYNRRVDEENIDLNRNFAIDNEHFKQKNEDYQKLNSFLNPNYEVKNSFKNRILFYATAFTRIVKSSIKSLRAATLKGQFDFFKGIFFAGKKPQQQSKILKDIVSYFSLDEYKNILTLDLHTGYGERGKLHYFGFMSRNIKNQKFFNLLFEDFTVDLGSDDDFYKVTGDLTVFMESLFNEENHLHAGITLEFGTLNSQTSFGAIESLRRVILENQGHHHGYVDKKSKESTTELFSNMFNPKDKQWRDAVLSQGKFTIKKLVKKINAL